MDKNIIKTLHPLERKTIPYLKQGTDELAIAEKSGLKQVEVVRALQWLENKGVLNLKPQEKEYILLDENGKKYKKQGLPEIKFLKAVQKPTHIKELSKILNKSEVNVCIGMFKDSITFKKGIINITEKGKKNLKKLKQSQSIFEKDFPLLYNGLSKQEKQIVDRLLERKDIFEIKTRKSKQITLTKLGKKLTKAKLNKELLENVTCSMLKNQTWKGKTFRHYDVKINVPDLYPGKRHFVNQAIDYVKKIWLELGFKEMQGPLVQTGFWNFDALFTAQDHPVREMQDTYYIKEPKYGRLVKPKVVERVKKTHENGWTTKSKGWQYKWDPKQAMRNVLRTHTTCLSARYISNLKKQDLPVKYFAVGKNFRNETLDWSHLFELIQVEGIVVDPDANFKNLIGYLKNFFIRMGYEDVRVRPGYFPYTEPSAEVDVFHPIRKEWVELGGSGIFRPELTKPLFGTEIPVIAWGLGFDRSILEYYKLKDIRDLYKNDLKQIKQMRMWLK